MKLGVVSSLATHPIRALLRQGVRVTVSTDDPTIFGCTLTGELQALVDHLGFSPADLARFQINAFGVAKLPSGVSADIRAEIERLVEQTTIGERREETGRPGEKETE